MQRQLWQKRMNLTERTYLEGMFGSVRLFAGSCLLGISPLAPEANDEAKQHDYIGAGGTIAMLVQNTAILQLSHHDRLKEKNPAGDFFMNIWVFSSAGGSA